MLNVRFLCSLVLLAGINLYADMVRYTFEGEVYQVSEYNNFCASQNVFVGTGVLYSIDVDFDADGYIFNPLTDTKSLYGDFYAEEVYGRVLESDPSIPQYTEMHYGTDNQLLIGNKYETFFLYTTEPLSEMAVGASAMSYETAFAGYMSPNHGMIVGVKSNLTLKSIEPLTTSSVPEAPATEMFIVSLAGFCLVLSSRLLKDRAFGKK